MHIRKTFEQRSEVEERMIAKNNEKIVCAGGSCTLEYLDKRSVGWHGYVSNTF